MPTNQRIVETVDVIKHPKGKITIEKTPPTRFGTLYFPKFEPKERDQSLGNYFVTAFKTIDEAKKHGMKIAEKHIKQHGKKKSMDLER